MIEPTLRFCNKLYSVPGRRIRPHTHNLWQFEAVLEGDIAVSIKGRKAVVSSGEAIYISPGMAHGFQYTERSLFISTRFELGSAPVPPSGTVLPSDRVQLVLLEALAGLMREGEGPPGRNAGEISGLLGILIERYVRLAESSDRSEDIVERAAAYVRSGNGRISNVSEVADELHVSRGYLSSRFSRERGQTLKKYIDEVRAECAEARLKYSENSLTDIAESMGFPDVYAFSRFFKRCSGQSPRSYRRSCRP